MITINNQNNPDLPIGIFDSGMGGLTVLRELKQHLPNESFIYLGDTARLPYGTKSHATVIKYATNMASVLVNKNIKLLIIACNTATTAAIEHLQKLLPDLPIIGVVTPGAQTAAKATRNNKVAVLATETTIASNIYQKTIQSLNPQIKVITQSCGLFVALAEEGCIDDEVAQAAVRKYLIPVINHSCQCDCILLGCTHFPALIKPLKSILGDDVILVDSAHATAQSVLTTLKSLQLEANSNQANIDYLVTDLPDRFIRVGEIFLGETINPAKVTLI